MNIFEFWRKETDNVNNATSTIVGFVPTVGTFEIRQGGQIVRTFPPRSHRRYKAPATFRPATPHELRELDYAAQNGWLQIERRPITGLFYGLGGEGVFAAQYCTPVVLWQARGKRS